MIKNCRYTIQFLDIDARLYVDIVIEMYGRLVTGRGRYCYFYFHQFQKQYFSRVCAVYAKRIFLEKQQHKNDMRGIKTKIQFRI